MKTYFLDRLPLILAISFGFISFSGLSQEGWTPLFNGKDLQGWERLNGDAEYLVRNGEIVGITKVNTPNSFLCTKARYADFILELEVWGDAALNSGIQFRSLSTPAFQNGRVHGYQAEIDPSPRAFSGGIYDEAKRGWIYPLTNHPEANRAYRVGNWNQYRIEAIGPSIRIWLNGVNTANLADHQIPSGFIALQVHSIGDQTSMAGREIRWRNIQIKTTNLESERWKMAPYTPEENYLPNTLTDYERKKGWRLLWDGKTNDGWRSARGPQFPEKGWEIKDGLLTVLEGSGGEASNGGDIITKEKFSNFELKLEFRITEGANSGVKYFVDPELNKGEGSSIGLEFQILDDERHPDAKLGVQGNRTLGSLYDLIPAENLSVPGTAKVFRGIGEWNQARIVVKGNHIQHWLNGFKVVEYERNTPMFRALVAYSKYKIWPGFGSLPEGHILLQDHGNRVSYRSIKIREF